MIRLEENKQYKINRKRKDPMFVPQGVPSSTDTGKARASKRWSNLRAPRPIKIQKDGKWVLYADYLRGEHWSNKRKEALNYWGYTCMQCGAIDITLNVHHTHYNDLWHENVSDLRVYCSECHNGLHL